MLSEDLVGSMCERPKMAAEYRRFCSRNFGNMTVNLRRQASFSISATAYRDGGYLLSRVITVGGRTQLIRTAADVAADGREEYGVMIPRIGSHEYVNRGEIGRASCRERVLRLV